MYNYMRTAITKWVTLCLPFVIMRWTTETIKQVINPLHKRGYNQIFAAKPS
jgi:hypothetical protein